MYEKPNKQTQMFKSFSASLFSLLLSLREYKSDAYFNIHSQHITNEHIYMNVMDCEAWAAVN